MYGLNIHLHSFSFDSNIVSPNDKIRVSITTIPEQNKQNFTIEAKKMNYVHHFFTVNITDQTKKVIFVFRKKSFIQNDPIIASTIIHDDQFPKILNDTSDTEMKTIDIYESLQKMKNHGIKSPNESRKVLGQMKVQLTLTEAYQTETITNRNVKAKSQDNMYNNNNNENQYQNEIYFIDNGIYN